MKKENLVLLALTVMATVTTGCARNFAGTYTGTEIISLTSNSTNGGMQTPTQPTTSTMTLVINQSSGTLLSGTWNSQGQTGMFQGTATGDSITGITLTMVGIPNAQNVNGMQGYGQMGGYGTAGYNAAAQQGLCNSFMGNLTLTTNNQVTGMLMVTPSAHAPSVQTQPAQVTQNYGGMSGLTCSGSRTITLNKSG